MALTEYLKWIHKHKRRRRKQPQRRIELGYHWQKKLGAAWKKMKGKRKRTSQEKQKWKHVRDENGRIKSKHEKREKHIA